MRTPQQLCVGFNVWMTHYEYGCTEDVNLEFFKDLSSATVEGTLSLTRVECPEECFPVSEREIRVSATFTGDGELASFREKSRIVDPLCSFAYSTRGASRSATAVVNVDGHIVEASGWVGVGMSKSRSTCRF